MLGGGGEAATVFIVGCDLQMGLTCTGKGRLGFCRIGDLLGESQVIKSGYILLLVARVIGR